MSVNVKTIPTVLGSNGSTGSVVVTRIGANGMNADQAYFNHIDADSATINNLEANQITTSILNGEIVNGEVVNGTQGNFKELNVDVANIYQENVDLSNIKNLYADFAGIKDLNAKKATIDVGHITELFSGNITTDYLTVLKSAHFFELIIDQIKAVGGSVILSPADGFEMYGWSSNTSSSIRIWWIAEEGKNGKYNMWEVGDQALCQNFNNAQVGVSHNVSSKYCWAAVTSTHDNEAKYVVKLNPNAEWTTSSDPAPKDEVTVITNAVYLATHPTLKKGDFAAVMTQEEKRYDENNNPLNGLWKLNGGTTILTPEEYDALPEADKANYSLYQDAYIAYVNANPIYITLEQYNGTVQYAGYTIRTYSKLEVKKCFSITISKSNADYTYYKESGVTKGSTFNFEEGDNFVQLGCQDTSLNRGNAIYLSAYNSIDQDLKAPLIAQYRNINTFDLSGCKWSWFDANGAKFKGQFVLEDGTPIDESVYDYFKIIPDYNILTKNANGEVDQQTIKVSILANINNVTSYNTTVPQGYTFRSENCRSNGQVISYTEKTSGQSTASIPVTEWQNVNFHHMNLKLYKNGTSPQLMDEYILNIQLVSQGSQGTVGPQGPQGDNGDDGTNVTLLAAQELCGVRIDDVSTNVTFEGMTTSLYTQLEYKLMQIVGDTVTELDWGAANGYRLTLSCWDGTIQYTSNSHEGSNYQLNQTDGWKYGGVNEDNTKILIFTQSNILTDSKLNGNQGQNFTNYQWLMTNYNSNQTAHDRTPLKFKLELKDHSWDVVESRMIYVSYEPQSLFVNNRDMLYSAKISSEAYTDTGVQGAKGYAVAQDQTVLTQTSQAIGLQATRLDSRIDGVQGTTSQLVVGVQGIQGSVSQLTTNLNTNYYTKTEVNQTAEQISLQVLGQQGVTQDQLRRTGIDIEDGSITLDAEKTIITGELAFGNQGSGVVLYDNNGNIVVQINNKQIGSPSDSSEVMQHTYGESTSSGTWEVTSDKIKIGSRNSGTSTTLSNITVGLGAYNNAGTAIYPSASTGMLRVKVYNSSNTVVYNQTFQLSKSNNIFYYNGSVSISFNSTSSYSIEFIITVDGSFSGTKANATFSYQISYGEQMMTRIGSNGMYAHQASGTYFLSNSTEHTMKNNTNGLRVVNKSNSAGVQTISSYDNNWYNIYNLRTYKFLSSGNFSSGNVYYGGSSHSVSHVYDINPNDGIYEYIIDTTIGTGDWYMRLPSIVTTPVGWRCKITLIKFSSNNSTVKIVANNEGSSTLSTGANVVIQDATLDGDGADNDNRGVTFNTIFNTELLCLGMSENVSGKFIGWRTDQDMLSL